MKLLEIFKQDLIEEAKKIKKPSSGLTKKQKSAVTKKAKAGKDIGKKGKGFKKVAAKAAKTYGSKEVGKKVAAAAMWKNVKRIKEANDMNEVGFTIPAEYSKEPLKSAYTKYQFLLYKNNGDQKKTLEDIVKMQNSIKDLSTVANSEKHKLYLDMEKIAREMIKEASNLQELSPELRDRAADKAVSLATSDYGSGDPLSAEKRIKQSKTFATQVSPAVKTKIENIFKDTDYETRISKGVHGATLRLTDRGAFNQFFEVNITKDKYDIDDTKNIMKKLMSNDKNKYDAITRKLLTAIKIIQKEELPKVTNLKEMDEEKDPEGQMAKVQLKKIAGYADKISKGLKDESQLDAWAQDHIAKASELMDQVGHFMAGKDNKNKKEE